MMAEYIIKGDPGAEGHDGRALAATERKMAEYINKTDLLERLQNVLQSEYPANKIKALYAHSVVLHAPAADVVEVETLKAWLYQIAMNNVGQPIEDMASACEEIANRLDGLRAFAREEQ